MNQKLICTISLVALITGCGGGGGSSNDDNELTTPENDINLSTALEGTWLKSCGAEDQNDSETFYDIVELKFINNQVSSNILVYTDSQCTIPSSLFPNPTASGGFSEGNKFVTSGGLTSTKIDTHIDRFTGALFMIDEFNIYFIDTNALYFGERNEANDGSTSALRPISLDFNRIFIRQ